jgi:predicted nucleic acid-binding protein
MRIALDAKTVAQLIEGDPPHLRERMDEALARGDELVMSSLVLHELAYAALASEQAARKLAQLDAFISQVEVVPWTSEDALTAARLRADQDMHSAGMFGLGLAELQCAGQALNNDWAMIAAESAPHPRNAPQPLRGRIASAAGPLQGLRTIDWSAPDDD